jgi:hypothetical protein
MIGRVKPKYSGKTCSSVALSTTNPTCCPDANPGRRGGKSATNRLSYDTATMEHNEERSDFKSSIIQPYY